MTAITWLGEDHLHADGIGPSATTWNGIRFPKDVPVNVDNEDMIRKARTNPFFSLDSGEVRRGPGRPRKVQAE